ncbi:VIT family protein [Massilia sp. Root335]|uniref:VIT1/CCC1 transporter family protein n=1 Tax=Massilia sp. Root335 TaxID=1736517 RepID=UPI0009EA8D74|nr:VIT family protein [Massilia sp. Root335]
MKKRHRERHRIQHIGWLRAAVLGANDGIISTSSLVTGVAAAHAAHRNIVLTAVAGLVAGAMSMATGEYVSVSSQSDTEKAAIAEEKAELEDDPLGEHRELAMIYVQRGLDRALATQVAQQLMKHDALATHARDELGISDLTAARPLQAAWTSAASFSMGAALPLAVTALAQGPNLAIYAHPLEKVKVLLTYRVFFTGTRNSRPLISFAHRWRHRRAGCDL